IFLCGAFALIGFPLDDVWHTLFGQDVTLWGPTHVLMVGGASLSTLGLWVLLVEARRTIGSPSRTSARGSAWRAQLVRFRAPAIGEAAILRFPLYLAEAAIVELVALRFGRERPLALAVAAGALIGTVGLAAEWGWSHIWMPLPWPSSLLPEAAILGLAAALAGAVLGGLIGRALNGNDVARAPVTAWAFP